MWRKVSGKTSAAEGIAAAKARGVVFGARKKEMPEDFEEWYFRWRRREITAQEMAEHCGVHITTIYHHARERNLPFQSVRGKKICQPPKSTDAKNTPSS